MTFTAHQCKLAVWTPGPVADDRVNETGDAEAVKKVADETRPSDHRTGGDGRAGIGEGKLEDPNRKKSDARGFIRCRRILQEEPVVADETVAMGKHKCEADGVEEKPAKAGVHNAFDKHVHCLAGSTEARFEHCESDLHSEH